MTSPVGIPEFDVDAVSAESTIEMPEETSAPQSFVVPVAGAVFLVALVLIVIAGQRETERNVLPDRQEPAPTTTIDPTPDELFVRQSENGAYTVRTIGDHSPFVATETPDGFFGLRRDGGAWLPMTSSNGIEWTTDIDSPIQGMPSTFRPGARRWGPEPLQYVDGQLWGRFMSRTLAGSSGAMLILRSDDGLTWQGIDSVPDGLDDAAFAGVPFRAPDDFVIQGDEVRTRTSTGEPVVFTVPDVDSAEWEIADVAANSNGATLLFYNSAELTFRLALTTDLVNWTTIGLEEKGPMAVEIIVVGSHAVLLRAADIADGPTELIVPLPPVGPNDPFQRRVLDLVVSPLTAMGSGYGGFVSGAEQDGRPLFVSSDNGFGWNRAEAQPATGLPTGAIPRGLWETPAGGLIGAFNDVDARTLWLASSPDGVEWSIGWEFRSEERVAAELVVPIDDGALVSVGFGRASQSDFEVRSYIWQTTDDQLFSIDLDAGSVVTAATDSPYGLVVAVSSANGQASDFGGQIRLYADSDSWTTLDSETEPFEAEGLVPTNFPEVWILTVNGAFRTDWGHLLDGDGDVLWEEVEGLIPEDLVGAVEVIDVQAGSGGAAALLLHPSELNQFTVVVTSDYRIWTPIPIGTESQGEPTHVQIDAVGEDEVLLSGFAQGPYRVRVPLGQ